MNIELSPWFLVGASLYALTSLCYLVDAWRTGQPISKRSTRVLDASLLYWSALLICWLYHTGGSGVSRLWFGLSALCIGFGFRLAKERYALSSLGGSVAALASLLGIFAYQHTPDKLGLNPSEELSYSLIAHIIFALAGFTAFAVSAAMSGLYLIAERRLKTKMLTSHTRRLPSLSTLDKFNLRGLIIGFPLYTIALLSGSAYAFQRSGELRLSYLVAIGSWLIYGGVLQARLTAGWRGKRAAYLTLVAFSGLLLVAARYSFR